MTQRYFGKYRGTVANNLDPERKGRIQAIVTDISQVALTSWCMPCFPVAGIAKGTLGVPPIGAGVWIEFEKGDPDQPIWSGCYYGDGAEIPSLHQMTPPPFDAYTIQTFAQNGLTVSDLPGPTGGIVLKSATGASIIVNDTGIYIDNGRGASIQMIGPTVTVNGGALVVT